MEDVIAHGTASPHGTPVALLYSESEDIYTSFSTAIKPVGLAGTIGAAKRALYVALRHLEWPVDVITEDDLEAFGRSGGTGGDPVVARLRTQYKSIFAVDTHIRVNASAGIALWVEQVNFKMNISPIIDRT